MSSASNVAIAGSWSGTKRSGRVMMEGLFPCEKRTAFHARDCTSEPIVNTDTLYQLTPSFIFTYTLLILF
jgi:hypothetical protein